MIRIDIVVVHVNQDVTTGCLCCDVPLLADRRMVIQCNVLDLRQIRDQILDLIISIVHDNPLQLIGRIGLAQKGLLRQSKELATIAGDSQNTHSRKFLFRRKEGLN